MLFLPEIEIHAGDERIIICKCNINSNILVTSGILKIINTWSMNLPFFINLK